LRPVDSNPPFFNKATTMDNVIEARLAGANATLSGILRVAQRHLPRGPFARVELRLSSRARDRLEIPVARAAIERCLRHQGMGRVAISIRSLDATCGSDVGEHVLRLYPAERRGPAEDDFVSPAVQPATWWARWREITWPVRRLKLASPEAATRCDEPVSREEADRLLRAAVRAAAARESAHGRHGPWAEAVVIVRRPALDAVFRQMLAPDDGVPACVDLAARTAWLSAHVRAEGHKVLSRFSVRFESKARAVGEGTTFAQQAVLEVRLVSRHDANTAAPDSG
jgi:hypothetical protein